ncbi:hypothetical protein [Nocardioides speluncae]|nr:hypothetical protein [Nocardioides speluncae]
MRARTAFAAWVCALVLAYAVGTFIARIIFNRYVLHPHPKES